MNPRASKVIRPELRVAYCRYCNSVKGIDDFSRTRGGGLRSKCIPCTAKGPTLADIRRGNLPYHMQTLFSSVQQRVENSKLKAANTRDLSRVIPFDITLSYLFLIYEQQQGRCALSGRKMTLGQSDNALPGKDAMSIDRIEPALGYVKDNIRFVTHQVNIAKGRHSDDDLIELARNIVAHQKTS